MQIIGPDALIFGVPNFNECCQYFSDYGLKNTYIDSTKAIYSALDGTSIEIHHEQSELLPPALKSGSLLRQQVYGVRNNEDLASIYNELIQDRAVQKNADGTLETSDDSGFSLKFQVTIRKEFNLDGEKINAPGSVQQRATNELGVHPQMDITPRTLSHVVLFVPNGEEAAKFYCERLGFKVTDILEGVGPFLRPSANDDHHCLFLIQTPESMQGIEHFAFHLAGPTEVMVAGTKFLEAGYTPFWGPGRHNFGSNWFWYFNSPLGCHVEYDADMDKHDDSWIPRSVPFSAEASQRFLLKYAEKWAPGADH